MPAPRLRLLAAAAGLGLVLTGCGTTATDTELFVVCESMRQVGVYRMSTSTAVSVAREVLMKNYGRSEKEAADIIEQALDEKCPEYKPEYR